MQEFIQAVRNASDAMAKMSYEWERLSREDDDTVQELPQWGEGFMISLDEIPSLLRSVAYDLENR